MFWSVASCLVISITILATAPKTSADFVFTDFWNLTGWPDGVAWILGLLQSALALCGYDAVAHMMEEMPRPRRDAPIAMMTAVGIGGITYDILLHYPFTTVKLTELEQWHCLYPRHALLHP